MESVFRNKVPHSDPDMLQKGFDEGKTKSGEKVDIGRKTLFLNTDSTSIKILLHYKKTFYYYLKIKTYNSSIFNS